MKLNKLVHSLKASFPIEISEPSIITFAKLIPPKTTQYEKVVSLINLTLLGIIIYSNFRHLKNTFSRKDSFENVIDFNLAHSLNA